jgi:hypothetical protein
MISDENIFGLFVGSFYSIAAPILAVLLYRRSLSVSSGNIALGVTAAVISQTVFFPLGTLFFGLEPFRRTCIFTFFFPFSYNTHGLLFCIR